MMTTQQRSLAIYTIAASMLAVPFIAMQFTNEINWSIFDFLIASVLLFITAFGVNTILNNVKLDSKRFIYISIILIVLLLVWAELAVGIFGSPFAGN